jgi:NADH-quinone oxidoreductase subunit M
MLTLYRRTVFGEMNPEVAKIKDLNAREVAIFLPLLVFTLWFGIYPTPVLDMTEGLSQELVSRLSEALSHAGEASALPHGSGH